MDATHDERAALLRIVGTLHLDYFLLAPGNDPEHTPFQGFGLDIANLEFAQLLDLLAALPASPFEIFFGAEFLPRFRRPLPRKRAAVISFPSLLARRAELTQQPDAIRVLIGMAREIEAARDVFRDPNAIFVTAPPVAGTVCLAQYKGHPAQLLDGAIHDKLATILPPDLWDRIATRPLRAPFAEGTVQSRAAGVTDANETLSISLGYAYSGVDHIVSSKTQEYVNAILTSVTQARDLMGESSTDIVLYAPGILRHLYAFGGPFWNSLLRKIPSKPMREMIRDGLFRNPNYSGSSLPVSRADLQNPYEHPVIGPVLLMRQIELRLMTAGIGALAASVMQPALRLPNAVNFHTASLREIEQHSTRNTPRARQLLQKTYRSMFEAMHRQIAPEIMEDLRTHTESITLVTDAPIEWLRVEGLPLMIRHDVSRIGMTPGNLMLQQCVFSRMMVVNATDLDDVLVVRAFAADDQIRGHLERAIDVFGIERLRIRFVDVHDRAELVACLNAFAGMLVVFDCHGGHGGDDGHGWLNIGRDKVDPWQLAGEARIPPIVILSACSTFALAGSHASVANGLIRSGAVSVVGTFLPVNSALSAIFVARLLYRIDAFLPALRDLNRNFVTWRTLVSTFLRMSFATDLRHFFSDKEWLDEEMSNRIGKQANYDINGLHPDWYRRLVRRIAWASRRPTSEIQTVIDTETPLVESMLYCQVGRPELIGINLLDLPAPKPKPLVTE